VISVADTSGIIAASDRNAREAASCRRVLQDAGTVSISVATSSLLARLRKIRS
jgi:uncharacterized protein